MTMILLDGSLKQRPTMVNSGRWLTTPHEQRLTKSSESQGEALHRERYDEEALARIEKAVGPRDWSALYQQNPVADDGDYFTRDMIQYYDRDDIDEERMRFYCAWDLAIGKNDRNDYTVGIVVGVDEYDQLFVMDVVRGRFDGFELVERYSTYMKYGNPQS